MEFSTCLQKPRYKHLYIQLLPPLWLTEKGEIALMQYHIYLASSHQEESIQTLLPFQDFKLLRLRISKWQEIVFCGKQIVLLTLKRKIVTHGIPTNTKVGSSSVPVQCYFLSRPPQNGSDHPFIIGRSGYPSCKLNYIYNSGNINHY